MPCILSIARGTRQGCPLSPLIFAIAIETLAVAIRNHPDIHSVRCGPYTHKCALFADDIPWFVTSPLISTPNILKLLHDFSQVSGLKVNMSKFHALNVSTPPVLVDRLRDHFSFTWNNKSIPYLGINLASSIDQLYTVNYSPLFKKPSTDLSQWSSLGLSLG